MTLFVWPLQYRRLERRGAWRFSVIGLRRVTVAYRVSRYDEGVVYQVWVPWLMLKLMVKA